MQEKKRAVWLAFFIGWEVLYKEVVFLILSVNYIWIGFGHCP